MKNPVMINEMDAFTFDKGGLNSWIKKKQTNPLTNEKGITLKNVSVNFDRRAIIQNAIEHLKIKGGRRRAKKTRKHYKTKTYKRVLSKKRK